MSQFHKEEVTHQRIRRECGWYSTIIPGMASLSRVVRTGELLQGGVVHLSTRLEYNIRTANDLLCLVFEKMCSVLNNSSVTRTQKRIFTQLKVKTVPLFSYMAAVLGFRYYLAFVNA